ncbi:penicillin-binding protein activator [Elioraea tepida]|uniref:Penicillin-binding protein activator n=1 Tax=Elioraea tepida TaxID=2843330 RepID=A0A975U180_9PROT|nr:penicillin-binding protein activator [Elioraea tepida]QXM23493.1 penicillin-binding protein activator [Elioraea tepida]
MRAGLLLPLSGPQAAVGRAMLDAATLALFQHEAPLVLLPKDTGGTPAGAAAAARAALAEGASILLGPLFAAETEAVGPLARAAGVNVLAFTTDASAARDNVFVLGQLPGPAVRRVVAAARSAGAERFAALVPDTPYGRAVLATFRAAVASSGGSVVREEIYAGNPAPAVQRLADYARRRGPVDAQIRAARALGTAEGRRRAAALAREARIPPPDFDALILADGGEQLRAVASLLPFYDIDNPPVRFLGTPLLAAMPDAGREPALVGTLYAAPDEARRAAFEARFAEAFGAAPPLVAGVAFDAAAIAAVLAAQGDVSRAALTDPAGFAGVFGIVRLLPDGTNQRGLALMEVTRGGARTVEPAPERFDDRVF